VGARPKFSYVRSKPYLRFVASFECFACRIQGQSQAAHSNQAKHGKGKSIKASDEFCFPLCIRHHAEHDQCLEMTKAERDEIEDRYITEMLARANARGWVNGRKK
jgi:hypothetical protein